MVKHVTKHVLYTRIEYLRKVIGADYSPPYNSKILCKVLRINLNEIKFKTPGLRGMSHISSRSVLIDSSLLPEEQNFFCMHEIMHQIFHCNNKTKTYSGYEVTQAEQNPFIEWEANEGAAQFLVPMQNFIPDYVELSRKHAHESCWTYGEDALFKELAKKYFVTPGVIHNRVNNLKYEIDYYLENGTLKGVKLLSNNHLKKIGWNRQNTKKFCIRCLSPLFKDFSYCHICGSEIFNPKDSDFDQFEQNLNNSNRGIGYMIYDGIETDTQGRALVCPRCGNEERTQEGCYCHICGTFLINKCSLTEEVDENGRCFTSQPCGHDEPLPGNARYCPYCGNETTYFQRGFLQSYNYEESRASLESITSDDGDLPF